MSNLVEIVDSLENKISKLLHKYEILRQANLQLEERLKNQESDIAKMQSQQHVLEQQNQTLKTANAMLGSNKHTRETKLKINSLIREIDQCIVQLSE